MNQLKARILAASAAVLLFTLAGCASGPDARSGTLGGIIEEVRVGRSCAARLTRKFGLVQNAGATKYLNQVAGALGAVSTRQEITFYVAILDSNEPNAMACPGGYVLVTKGALKALNDESELAFLLGEQVAHVALRHMAGYTNGVRSADVESAVDRLEGMLTGGGLGGGKVMESDQAAVIYMATLGYDVAGATRALQKINGDGYRNSHPDAGSRAAAIQRFQTENGIRAGGQTNQARYTGSAGRL